MVIFTKRNLSIQSLIKVVCKLAVLSVLLNVMLWLRNAIKIKPSSSEAQDSKIAAALTFTDITSGNIKIDAHDDRLIRHIVKYHLIAPPTSEDLDESPDVLVKDVYEQQEVSRYAINYFKRKRDGFYIECGANDGVFFSNTLPLETMYNWDGLLIEADPRPFSRLIKRNRNAWITNTCLSTTSYPSKVKMMRNNKMEGLSFLPGHLNILRVDEDLTEFEAQCFPLYSILLAINVTTVDYFSLDIEGAELNVLKTIPWDKVVIKMLSIEVHPEYVNPVREYMQSVGYKYLAFIKNGYSHDQIYVLEKTS